MMPFQITPRSITLWQWFWPLCFFLCLFSNFLAAGGIVFQKHIFQSTLVILYAYFRVRPSEFGHYHTCQVSRFCGGVSGFCTLSPPMNRLPNARNKISGFLTHPADFSRFNVLFQQNYERSERGRFSAPTPLKSGNSTCTMYALQSYQWQLAAYIWYEKFNKKFYTGGRFIIHMTSMVYQWMVVSFYMRINGVIQ